MDGWMVHACTRYRLTAHKDLQIADPPTSALHISPRPLHATAKRVTMKLYFRLLHVLRLSLSFLLLAIAIASREVAGDPTGTQCKSASGREETCVCQTESGIIDLTPLSKSDGKPRFANLGDNNDDKLSYSYNPCRTFQNGDNNDPCNDVFLCQFVDGSDNENLAPPLSEQMWIEEDGTPYVYYSNAANQNRESTVYLNCNPGVALEETTAVADGEVKGRLHYYFNISSCQVCPGGCSGHVGPSSDKSRLVGIIGVVLIIVLILSIISYFVVGALVNKFHRKSSGMDIIPNRQLWLQLPILVKEGFLFTIGPCYRLVKRKVGNSKEYSHM